MENPNLKSLQIGLDASAKAQDAIQALIDSITDDCLRQMPNVTRAEIQDFMNRGCDLMAYFLGMNFVEDTPMHRIINLLAQLEGARRAAELVQHGCASNLMANESSS